MKQLERDVLTTRVVRHRNIFGHSFRTIASSLLIPLATVHRWYISRKRPGRGLLNAVKECISRITDANVCRTRDDIRQMLAMNGLNVSNSTISRAAARTISKRKVYPYKPVNQGNVALRETFSGYISNNPAVWEDVISIDECAVYLNCNRQAAWYRRGPKLRTRDDNNGSRIKVSVIMAVHPVHGIIHSKVIPGNYNKVEFGHFVRELHQHLPASMGPARLLMDNVAFHKSAEIVKLYNEFGMETLFVPPYTSEWNPIERVFHMIKSKFRSTVTANLLKDRGAALKSLADIIQQVHETQRVEIANIYNYVRSIVVAMRPLGRSSVTIG